MDSLRKELQMTDYDAMRDSLSKLTVKALRAIARNEGICLSYSGATKRGMVDEIVSQRRNRDMEEARAMA